MFLPRLVCIAFLAVVGSAVVCQVAFSDSISWTKGSNGISTLTYGGFNFMNSDSTGQPGTACIAVPTFSPAWSGSNSQTGHYWNGDTLTQTFQWGSIDYAFSLPTPDRFSVAITVHNTNTGYTLTNLDLYWPFTISTPNPASFYDPNWGHQTLDPDHRPYMSKVTTPGAAIFDYGAYNGVTTMHAWRIDTPAPATGISLYINSFGPGYLVHPIIANTVPPGGTTTAAYSMKFGPGGSTILDLAGDTYQDFDSCYPLRMNWSDRRMIGRMFLASTVPHPADGKNPRGWNNNDDTIDVINPSTGQVDPAGYVRFQQVLMSSVNSYISRLKNYTGISGQTGMNCQGVVVWDIEGQQYYHPLSYPGDPDMVGSLAPEMTYTDATYTTPLCDRIFTAFKNAGFKVGVCLRPQQMVWHPELGRYNQDYPADTGLELYNDVTYATNRWGCTLFYVDTTVDASGNSLPGPALWQRTLDAYPNILVMGENQNATYYAFGAPYDDRSVDGVTATGPSKLEMYQGAATAIQVGTYWSTDHDAILAGMKRGDIYFGDGWYDNAQTTAILGLYKEAGARPAVNITSPTAGTLVINQPSLAMQASASGNGKTVSKVEWYVGPIKVGEATAAPYIFIWTGFQMNTSYNLYAKVTTTDGSSAVSTPVKVTIGSATILNKTRDIKSVANGAYVSTGQSMVVTAASSAYSDGSIYMEDSDRTGGIKLIGAGTAQVGDNISVTGVMDTDGNGEKALRVWRVDSKTAGTPLRALGMNNKTFSASGQLVTVWGKVTSRSASSLALDDGSGQPASVQIDGLVTPLGSIPGVGDFVAATGPAGLMTGAVPAVKVRSMWDMQDYSNCLSPAFSLAPGTYMGAQTVIMSCATPGATIRYTTDGSTPSATNGTIGTSVTIVSSCNLQAIAYADGFVDSPVVGGDYQIYYVTCAQPIFSLAQGSYIGTQTVNLSTATSGATIRYTLDGSAPSRTNGIVGTSVTIPSSCTLKVIAYMTGAIDSSVASASYTIKNWMAAGSIIAGPISTPNSKLTSPGFSAVYDLPTGLGVSGGVVSDLKLTYTLTVTGVSGYGSQRAGDSGIGLYLASTPDSTKGLYIGVFCDHDNTPYEGAYMSNSTGASAPTVGGDVFAFDLELQVVGGVATTVVSGLNSATYTVTSTDISNWNGLTKWAVFHSGPGNPWQYVVATATNIQFFKLQ